MKSMHTTLKLASSFQQGNTTGDYVGAHLCSCARCRYVCARYLLCDALLPRGVHLRFILSWGRYGWLAYMRDSFYDVPASHPNEHRNRVWWLCFLYIPRLGQVEHHSPRAGAPGETGGWAVCPSTRPRHMRPGRADGPRQRRRWLGGFFLVCWSSGLGFDSLGGNWPLHLCPGRPRNRVRLLP